MAKLQILRLLRRSSLQLDRNRSVTKAGTALTCGNHRKVVDSSTRRNRSGKLLVNVKTKAQKAAKRVEAKVRNSKTWFSLDRLLTLECLTKIVLIVVMFQCSFLVCFSFLVLPVQTPCVIKDINVQIINSSKLTKFCNYILNKLHSIDYILTLDKLTTVLQEVQKVYLANKIYKNQKMFLSMSKMAKLPKGFTHLAIKCFNNKM